MTLAAATALAVGVGFLPVRGAAAGPGPLVTGNAVALLAATAALVQPRAGRARDAGRLRRRGGVNYQAEFQPFHYLRTRSTTARSRSLAVGGHITTGAVTSVNWG